MLCWECVQDVLCCAGSVFRVFLVGSMHRTFYAVLGVCRGRSMLCWECVQDVLCWECVEDVPDLAPCDFWLFPLLKDKLAEGKFSRVQDLAKAVNSELKTIPKEEYRKTSWLRRLQHYISVEGELVHRGNPVIWNRCVQNCSRYFRLINSLDHTS